MPKTTVIEIETGDGSVYQFHRPTLERVLKISRAEEARSTKADDDAAEIDRTFNAYHVSVNMTASELEAWADSPCSHLASLTRAPIERNLRLLSKPKSDWTKDDAADAKRTIAFIARMGEVAAGDQVSDDCPMSKRTIALRNWGRDPGKATKADRTISEIATREIGIAMKSAEEQTVFGLVLEPTDGENGAPLNPDTQGEIYSREVIRAAAHGWMLNHRLFDVQHEVYLGEQQAKVAESYLAPVDFDLHMPDGSTRRIYEGTWLMVVKILDLKLWDSIKTGKITGFSINGFVARETVKVRRQKAAGPAPTICLYHRDQDGAMSAAIVLHSVSPGPIDLVSVQYGEPFPFEQLAGRQRVFVVDFMPQPFCEIECLAEMCDAMGITLTLVDHHAEAIRKLNDSPLAGKISGVQESAELDGPVAPSECLAGCDLTWQLLSPDQPKPELVRLVGRWDVWDHADELVRPVAYALEAQGLDPVKWEEMLSLTREAIAVGLGEEGRPIVAWLERQSEARMRDRAFPVQLDGLNCLAVNTDTKGSIQFECIDRLGLAGYQAGIAFVRSPRGWSVSLYPLAEGVDVGAICSKYGGSGHHGAGGFQCSDLPFDLP